MILKILLYISGYLKVSIIGDKKERFINLCCNRNIEIWGLSDIEDGYLCYMSVGDFRKIKGIARKSHMKILIKKKFGLPFLLHKYRKRKAFVAGIVTAFVIVYLLSGFIWDISIDGNYSYSSYEILDFLKQNNVYHGMKRNDIDCETIEKNVRNEYFDITWVSVELTGTRLIVHIKENFDDIRQEDEDVNAWGEKGCSIVSDKEAVIESIITRSGTPLVKVGDTVNPDSVMIDGKYDILDDYGVILRTEYLKADGDIIGRVVYNYSETIDRKYIMRKYTGEQKTFHIYRIQDNEINLFSNKVDYEYYDKIVEEEQLSIANNFCLPIYFSSMTYREYENIEVFYTDVQLQELSEKKLSVFLENLAKKGIQIIENNVRIEVGINEVKSTGEIIVLENIGVKISNE